MTTHDRVAPESLGVAALFDASPAVEVHTSAAAMTAFICGLGALFAAPFTLTFSIALGLGLLGCCAAVGGVVATSRSRVAGRALAPAGLFFSLVALAVVGLRYANLDTAFGDQLVATLRALLDQLNALLRMP
jgi:hypothetical protein